jgi:glycosyltransferase involved in cell wall biosynthesis
MPAVAVVVPFFNRRNSLPATLDSVQSQTLLPRRAILVDDGSTDRGADVARVWIDAVSDRIDGRLIRQPNRGVAAARNQGLALAVDCDYVAFLDSDDVWPPDFLERTHAALSADSDAVAASADRQFTYSDGRSSTEDCSSLAANSCLWMLRCGAGIMSSTLLRRSSIDRYHGFDCQLMTGEDAALLLRISLDGPWLHVRGQPVAFRHGLPPGDEGNKSEKYRDNFLTWARIFDDFFVRGPGRRFLTDRQIRRQLAVRWLRAGEQQSRLGAPAIALSCFRKARRWNPWRAKYYRLILNTLVAALVGRSRIRENSAGDSSVARAEEFSGMSRRSGAFRVAPTGESPTPT